MSHLLQGWGHALRMFAISKGGRSLLLKLDAGSYYRASASPPPPPPGMANEQKLLPSCTPWAFLFVLVRCQAVLGLWR